MKKIYFACSIRGGRDDAMTYAEIVRYMKQKATVLSEIFTDGKLTSQGMDRPSQTIWKTDTNWIKEADVIIAEVTNPSLGVGYEIALAETLRKPVLALFKDSSERKLSAMIDGAPGVRVYKYREVSDAMVAIDKFLNQVGP